MYGCGGVCIRVYGSRGNAPGFIVCNVQPCDSWKTPARKLNDKLFFNWQTEVKRQKEIYFSRIAIVPQTERAEIRDAKQARYRKVQLFIQIQRYLYTPVICFPSHEKQGKFSGGCRGGDVVSHASNS